jgi:hypothetical protein
MGRSIFAWVLIAVGLAAVTGGLAMGYIFSVVKKSEEDTARVNARLDPYGMNFDPPRKPWIQEYAPAWISVLAGIVLAVIGLNLRVVAPKKRPRRERVEAGLKQTCSACGRRSPATAMRCYHCGQGFLPV